MFQIKNVTKKYQAEFVLNNCSFAMDKGLNFIVGASGSGKTTLLKLMSGMDQSFEGEVFYNGVEMKALTENQRSAFYNEIFGFLWQDFNLLEEATVLENVLLPQYLKETDGKRRAEEILKELNIFGVATQKVRHLSGGQKQRVALARELMKDPQVIFADEPTSALDEQSSASVMHLLEELAKTRTVVIVTHDHSLITPDARVYDLDEGVFPALFEEELEQAEVTLPNKQRLSLIHAWQLGSINLKNNLGRSLISVLSLLIASLLLLTIVSGSIEGSTQDEFDELLANYGEGLKDISVIGSFMSASGTDDQEEDKPSGDVTQDIGGLYQKYQGDERVAFATFIQSFDNIRVNIDGKEYPIEGSGNTPVISQLLAGKMPGEKAGEVVVPKKLVEDLGITPEEALGKTFEFHSEMYNWETGEPVLKAVSTTVTIVGVAANEMAIEYEGEFMNFSIDDSFFFDKTTLDDLRQQAEIQGAAVNFLMRSKTPQDLISLKNELNRQGIVPLGQFELVEDLVRLNEQTNDQSSAANGLVIALSLLIVGVIGIITGMMRKREFAIYKVAGFNQQHFMAYQLLEKGIEVLFSLLLMVLLSPMINQFSQQMFGKVLLTGETIALGILFVFLMGAFTWLLTLLIIKGTKVSLALQTGDR